MKVKSNNKKGREGLLLLLPIQHPVSVSRKKRYTSRERYLKAANNKQGRHFWEREAEYTP